MLEAGIVNAKVAGIAEEHVVLVLVVLLMVMVVIIILILVVILINMVLIIAILLVVKMQAAMTHTKVEHCAWKAAASLF